MGAVAIVACLVAVLQTLLQTQGELVLVLVLFRVLLADLFIHHNYDELAYPYFFFTFSCVSSNVDDTIGHKRRKKQIFTLSLRNHLLL